MSFALDARKIIAVLLVFVFAVSLIPAISNSIGMYTPAVVAQSQQNGGNLIVGYTNEPLHIFNPVILFSAYAYLMNALTYESLVQWNQNLGIIPDLATNYTISSNGTVYTFNLRQNVSWVQYVN